ncbi:uncharacterized protein A1O9_00083, partial [Exophiala aquamarina CBS 119918]
MNNLTLTGNPEKHDTSHIHQTATSTFNYGHGSHRSAAPANILRRSATGAGRLSSSQVPKPRDSMMESLSRHVEAGPSIRQTKTSAMRLQNSLEKRSQSSPLARHGVTETGSPYSFPARSNSGQGKGKAPLDEFRRYIPQESVGLPSTEKKASDGYDPSRYKSSIPLPIRSSRQSPEYIDPDPKTSFIYQNAAGVIEADQNDLRKCTPGFLPTADPQGSGDQFAGYELPAAMSDEDFLADDTPDGSVENSDDNVHDGSDNPVHGYDKDGAFHIRRLRAADASGPTLIVRDEASDLLLGVEDAPATQSNSTAGLRLRRTQRGLRGLAIETITNRSFATRRGDSSEDDMQRLLPDTDLDNDGLMHDNDDEQHDWDQGPPYTSVHHSIAVESSSSCLPSGHDQTNLERFALPSNHVIAVSQDSSPEGPDPGPIQRLRTRPSTIGRPSQVTQRVDPSKQNAQLWFQGVDEEDLSQEQSIDDLPSRIHGMEPGAFTPAATSYPTRTSSRKPKANPAPIDISSTKGIETGNRFLEQASKAQAPKLRGMRLPRLVKTFSQSVSPGPEAASESHQGPSSSKKVLSQMRGLFAKRSTDFQRGDGSVTSSLRKIPSKLGVRNFDSVRHNRVQQSAKFPNTLLNPGSAVRESSSSDNNTQEFVISDPFADPVTPFTAGIMDSSTTSTSESQVNPDSASPIIPASASLIPHRSSTPALSETPTPTPPASLDSATELVHTLLNRALAEPDGERKVQFIELSKCMVAIVNKARDGAKALEQAKIEAAKAEMTWLKIQQDMDHLEGVLRNMLSGPT